MGKEKSKSQGRNHLHSRISYLHQASTYIANPQKEKSNTVQSVQPDSGDLFIHPQEDEGHSRHANDSYVSSSHVSSRMKLERNTLPALSRQMIEDLRSVSLKCQERLAPNVKHSICKRCNSLLVAGSTSTNHLENKSRGGRKPWADVLVVTCRTCGIQKRFPVGSKHQLRKSERIRTQKKDPP